MLCDRRLTIEELEEMAHAIRNDILKMTLSAGANGGHIGGSFSSAEILAVLYGNVMNVSPDKATDPSRDRFILSKGHCAIAHYAVLKESGFLTEEEMLSFEQPGSDFPTHEVMNLAKGIETSSGSLGYGLSIGIGCAISAKLKNSQHRIFVLMGDGECNEGSIWEAAMAASRFKLGNLTAIIDKNGQSLDGFTAEIMPINNMKLAWEAFGWNVRETNGNSIQSMLDAFSNQTEDKPNLIIANTIKGKGIPSIEGRTGWHHVRLTQEMYDVFMKEMEG